MLTPYGTLGRVESLDGGRSALPSLPSAARSEGPTNHVVLTLAGVLEEDSGLGAASSVDSL